MSETACGSYEIVKEGEDIILKIDFENCTFLPLVEDDEKAMSLVIGILAESGTVTKIILSKKRDYEYDYEQTQILYEIAELYKKLLREKAQYNLFGDLACRRFLESKYVELEDVLYTNLKGDPIGAYVELIRIKRREQSIQEQGAVTPEVIKCQKKYFTLITEIITHLEESKLIKIAKPSLPGYKIGDREIYRSILSAITKPDFMYTKLMCSYPIEGELLESYVVNNTEVAIFTIPETLQYIYHIIPPEFKLNEEKYELLDAAKNILAEHKPTRSEFIDPERLREVFYNLGNDLIDELAGYRGIKLRERERKELAEILVRYTIGFGLVEVLLEDDKVQDVTINSPLGKTPIFIIHQDYGDCKTNILPSVPEAESWASKLRLISARPLDEANPILDTELILPKARARVAAITSPLNPTGIAFALRRHRDKPWTLPLFIKTKMITPLAAGVISFLVDGNRTVLVAGTRSAGKTSLLGSLMTELTRRGRIITIEDTLELSVDFFRKMNYNIQSMKVASALTRGTTEVSADEGIRSTLRLGDSSLIVGEVRSVEAKALYEAMRVGALANLVAGTIHGDSPYGVFDRVVNDLGVPKTSFKATDIIIVANQIKSAEGIEKRRRVTSITEVRKFWEEDPIREKGFVDLFRYDARKDVLEPTQDLLAGDSDVLKAIASTVKEWAGNWSAVWENINLRAKVKETIVDVSNNEHLPELLEAEFVIIANEEFNRISKKIKEEVGSLNSDAIFFEWNEWLKRTVKQKKIYENKE